MINTNKPKIIVLSSIFIAIDIILTRFFSFSIPGFAKIDLQAVVSIICGYLLGPFWATISLVASDIIGAILNPGRLGFVFGFTLSAALKGMLYGLAFKNNKSPSILYTTIAISAVYISIDVLINNIWLSIMTSTSYFPLLYTRILPRTILLIFTIILSTSFIKLILNINKNNIYKN